MRGGPGRSRILGESEEIRKRPQKVFVGVVKSNWTSTGIGIGIGIALGTELLTGETT